MVQTSPLIRENLDCEHLLVDALLHHMLPERRPTTVQPRHSTLGNLYAIGGMDNSKGIVWFQPFFYHILVLIFF